MHQPIDDSFLMGAPHFTTYRLKSFHVLYQSSQLKIYCLMAHVATEKIMITRKLIIPPI